MLITWFMNLLISWPNIRMLKTKTGKYQMKSSRETTNPLRYFPATRILTLKLQNRWQYLIIPQCFFKESGTFNRTIGLQFGRSLPIIWLLSPNLNLWLCFPIKIWIWQHFIDRRALNQLCAKRKTYSPWSFHKNIVYQWQCYLFTGKKKILNMPKHTTAIGYTEIHSIVRS